MLYDNLRSNTLAEVEYMILKEWFDFLVASQDIKVDLFGKLHLFLMNNQFVYIFGSQLLYARYPYYTA